LAAAISGSFASNMLPTILIYAFLGAILGGALGFAYKHLKKDRLLQDISHQEFEIQVATLRHHYKNLAIGVQGFSQRIKRKLDELDEVMGRNLEVENPEYHPFKKEISKLKQDIAILKDAAQRLTDTLGHELLFLKALTSDSSEYRPQDLYPILTASIKELLRLRFREKPIQMKINNRPWEGCQDSLVFPFDPYGLEIILQNILSNAMKYGDSIKVRVFDKGDKVQIEVEDNGPGIEAEKLQQQMRTPSDQRKPESTLLGLQVTIHLLARIGGRLAVSSLPQKGTTFFVILPKPPELTT
jgi:signal transduction histidine kinase